jgi:hypothetical protein
VAFVKLGLNRHLDYHCCILDGVGSVQNLHLTCTSVICRFMGGNVTAHEFPQHLRSGLILRAADLKETLAFLRGLIQTAHNLKVAS